MYLFLIPVENICAILKKETSFNEDTLRHKLKNVFTNSRNIEFLVKLLHINAEVTFSVDESTVSLRGAGYESDRLVFWYEVEFHSQTESQAIMKVIRESIKLQEDTCWIYNQKIELTGSEQDAISVKLPIQEDTALFAPFFILMMIRAFMNNIDFFFTKKDDLSLCEPAIFSHSLIPLYFTVASKCDDNERHVNEGAMRLLHNMISGVNVNYQENKATGANKISDVPCLEEMAGERDVTSLCALGLQPRSFETISHYLYSIRQGKGKVKAAKDVFKIETLKPVMNHTDIYWVKR